MRHALSEITTQMKVTTISLPDSPFRATGQLAHYMKKSRNRLYAEAIAEYVRANSSGAITERLNTVYRAESSAIDPSLKKAQNKHLRNELW